MTTLEGVSLDIVDCEHKTAPLDEMGDYFAVGTPAMRGNAIDYGEARRISAETFEAWTRRLRPVHGDLLLAREAPVGPVVAIPPELNVAPGQRTVLIRPNPDVVNSQFLYYLLASPLQQRRLVERAAGSTVPHLNVADVRDFGLPRLPPLQEQRAIAEVLGALDDKIAANRRMIDSVDHLVDALFASEDHRLGEDTFADVATVGGGGTPKTKIEAYWGGDVHWATPTDVTSLDGLWLGKTSRTITRAGLENCSSNLYPASSILMTSRATIGAFALAAQPTAVNQGFIVVNARDSRIQLWLYAQMRARVTEFLSHANGATFLELSRGRFKSLPVWSADEEVMVRFSQSVSPLLERVRAAQGENDRLTSTRDALLPLLMSGKVRVKDLGDQVGEMV